MPPTSAETAAAVPSKRSGNRCRATKGIRRWRRPGPDVVAEAPRTLTRDVGVAAPKPGAATDLAGEPGWLGRYDRADRAPGSDTSRAVAPSDHARRRRV